MPITVLMRKGTPLDGSAPLLLYGYGAYGIPQEADLLDPQPQPGRPRLDLGDRAHPRRLGQGLGLVPRRPQGQEDQHLHRLHRLRRASGRARATATAGRIAAYGGSAGGMLMGAIANMRPDLWGAIIAAVPFVDVLNTMSDTTPAADPAGVARVGQPAEGRGGLRLHRQLQPLRQRRAPSPIRRSWPPAASPIRASPGGSRRSGSRGCASTRPATRPMLLKINMEAGHGGASGRFDFLKEIALDYAFAVWAIERGWEARRDDPAGERGRRRGGRGDLRPPRAARLRHLRGGRRRRTPRWPARIAAVQALRPALPGRRGRGRPVLGFAYAAPFRPARRLPLHGRGQRLRRTRTAIGQGVGKALVAEVIARLRGDGRCARWWR